MNDTKETAKPANHRQFLQFAKFTMFSISAGVIQAGSFALLNETTGMPYWFSVMFRNSSLTGSTEKTKVYEIFKLLTLNTKVRVK